MNRRHAALAVAVLSPALIWAAPAAAERQAPRCSEEMSALLLKHARKHGVPIDLLHRVVIRESRYNAAARHSRYFGLMQITYATAKSMGYHGAPGGLLDAETNLTYGVPYLANAYMLSRGNDDRAVRLYAAGYYGTAKQQHRIADLRTADSPPAVPVQVASAPAAPQNPVAQLFGILTSAPAEQRAPAAVETAAAASDTKVADLKAGKPTAASDQGAAAATSKDKHGSRTAKARAKAAHAEELQVASADTSAASSDGLRGSADTGAAKAGNEAAAEPQAEPAVTKGHKRPARSARKARSLSEPATATADAGTTVVAGGDAAASENASATKAPDASKRGHGASKQVAASADEADGDAAPVAKHAKAKARHAHLQQAAAAKADVTPDP